MGILLKVLGVILGVLLCSAGFRFMSLPVTSMDELVSVLPILIGVVLTVSSVVRLVRWTQVKSAGESDGLLFWEGAIGAFLGIALLSSWALRASLAISMNVLMAVWAGILVLSSGVIRIARALKLRSANEMLAVVGNVQFNWVLELVLGVLIAIGGIFSLCNPLTTLAAIGMLFGVEIVFYGVTMIISSLALY